MFNLLKIAGFSAYITVVFLNAFVDLGHKIIIQNTVFKAYDGDTQIILSAIVNALILLPFVLLFTPAGFVSDRFAKTKVMRISAWLAVALTLVITACYYQGMFELAFAMTFLLAMQSAIYSPAKYGFIRDLVGSNRLAEANGFVQVATTLAILLGTFAFSILFERYLTGFQSIDKADIIQRIAPIGWFLVAGACIELAFAYRLPTFAPVNDALKFDWPAYRTGKTLSDNLGAVRRHDTIWLSIVGLSVFWAIAQVLLSSFPAFAKAEMGITNTVVIQGLLACAGFGIVLGSAMASKASANHIETGLIPIGAIGVAMCVVVLPSLSTPVAIACDFIALGFLGGLFIVPLNALIQYHAPEHQRGRILSGNNLVQNATMLVFLGLTVLLAVQEIGPQALFVLLGIVAIGGAIYTLYKVPQSLVRYLVNEIFRSKYRVKMLGFEHFPESGGVLLLGNHISWVDWAIVQMASPRPVRFLMERGIYERWYLKWFLDFFGTIPISAGNYQQSLERVTQLLNEGEVVCLFPEGTISRNGQLCEFKHGYEKAAANADGVIVPFYLRGLWGSSFSRSNSGLREHRKSGRKRDIIVAFGAPLAMNTQAEALKQKIFELSISAWHEYTDTLPDVGAAWLSTAKRLASKVAISESTGARLTHRRFATGVLLLSRRLKKMVRAQNVGVLLPASGAGALANLAVLNCGKTTVNLNYTAPIDSITRAVDKAGLTHVLTSRKFISKLRDRGIELDAVEEKCTFVILEEEMTQPSAIEKFVTLALFSVLPTSLVIRLFHRKTPIDKPAAILFSSGSEGEPKGVVLSHKNLMSNIHQVSDVLNTETDDVVMASLPLFHAFGLTVTTFMPLVEGIPVVAHPDPTDAPNIGKAVAKFRATVLFGTSTFFRLYTKNKRLQPLMFNSLRTVVAGAEKLAPAVREGFKLKFNKDIYEGYGATETTPVASVNVPDELDVRSWKVQQGSKTGTVGLPLPGTSFRIVDPQSLESLDNNSDGLILIGGNQVMLGYLDDPEKTAEVIVELDGTRWYKTGDKGHIDDDGFLTIVDRYSRFAKIGGEMVSLSKVEQQVRETLGDAELECVAVAVPDQKKGESIILLLSSNDNADDFATRMRKQLVDGQMNPLMLPAQIFRVDDVPALASGKTDFVKAREMALSFAA